MSANFCKVNLQFTAMVKVKMAELSHWCGVCLTISNAATHRTPFHDQDALRGVAGYLRNSRRRGGARTALSRDVSGLAGLDAGRRLHRCGVHRRREVARLRSQARAGGRLGAVRRSASAEISYWS